MPSLYSRLLLPRLIDCACGLGVDPGVEMHPLALRRGHFAGYHYWGWAGRG